ncbi:RNA polymerase sigma factor [Pareuzebyella sediminis]|uniref:RNA polymerase sigma factor n=1 Tax=Pareuzebyella sediminis TaxID=2607998 RepID=UPI0018E117E9|nr:sigma-70 family RNA polymerase sigma factor [Pareuzebyella sediminis]
MYDIYIDDLFSFGTEYSKDREYVMDCIHDLFFDLYKYRVKLNMTDNVKSYLFKSLRRKVNRKYSRKILPQQTKYPFSTKDLQTDHTSSVEEDIIRSENTAEKSAKLTTALETLTKKQKKGLLLRFYQDKSYEEIAEIMKTSIPTARTTIYRAIKMLRRQPLSLFVLLHSYLFS